MHRPCITLHALVTSPSPIFHNLSHLHDTFCVTCLQLRGRPEDIRSGNGPEFVTRKVKRWQEQAEVETLYIAKGSPWENGYFES